MAAPFDIRSLVKSSDFFLNFVFLTKFCFLLSDSLFLVVVCEDVTMTKEHLLISRF